MKFCPKCGKKGIKENFCAKCKEEMNPLRKMPKDIAITICAQSKTFKFKNKWVEYSSLKEVVVKTVQRFFPEKGTTINPIIGNIYQNPGIKQRIEVELIISKNEVYAFPVVLEFTICPKLAKKGSQYFEGVLQLRKPRDEIIEYIRSEVKKQESKGIHINKEEVVNNGVDFYMTSQKYIQLLGAKLQNAFGGTLKISPQLFTRDKQTCKDLYRVNAAYTPPEFIKNDVIKVTDKIEKIIKVRKTAKQVIGRELTSGKNVMAEYKKKEVEILPKIKTTVAKTYPNVEIVDPETYQPIAVENKELQKSYKQGQNVKTVKDKGRWWIVE